MRIWNCFIWKIERNWEVNECLYPVSGSGLQVDKIPSKKGKSDVQFKSISLFDVEYDFYTMRSIAYRSLYLGSRVFVISVGIKLKSRHSFSWCFAR